MVDNNNGDILSNRGIYFLWENITSESCEKASKFILEKSYCPKPPPYISLVINSNGGNLYSSFALSEMMAGSSIPVYTWGVGTIASAGLTIFISGKKGHRFLTPNTLILSHQYSSFSFGKHHHLMSDRKRVDLTMERMIKHYEKHTGLDEKIIKEKLLPPEDVWLTAEEAVEYNLADGIKMTGAK